MLELLSLGLSTTFYLLALPHANWPSHMFIAANSGSFICWAFLDLCQPGFQLWWEPHHNDHDTLYEGAFVSIPLISTIALYCTSALLFTGSVLPGNLLWYILLELCSSHTYRQMDWRTKEASVSAQQACRITNTNCKATKVRKYRRHSSDYSSMPETKWGFTLTALN